MPIHLHIEGENAEQLVAEVQTLADKLSGNPPVDSPAPVPAPQAPQPDAIAAAPEAPTPPVAPPAPTGPANAAPQENTLPPSDAPKEDRRDEHGVVFNPQYCGEAKDPFYATGKRKGQWKKKKNLDDIQYDTWYESVKPDAPAAPEPPAADAAAAFGNAPAAPATSAYPADIGGFTAWLSERQNAGQINQTHVDHAYRARGLSFQDLLPPTDEGQIAQNVAALCAEIETYVR